METKTQTRMHKALEVLIFLSANPKSTRAQLAEGLGVHVKAASKYMKILQGLNTKGTELVDAVIPAGDARGAWRYSLTEEGQDTLGMLTPIEPLFTEEWAEYKARRKG